MKIAYCDCFSGISGDMFLAALLDAGMPLEHLQAQLALLKLPEHFEISVSQTHKGALVASLLEIKLGEHAHAHEHEHDHEGHEHTVQEHTVHEHTVQEHMVQEHMVQEHTLQVHAHQRDYSEIRELIDASDLSPAVKNASQAIFLRLAEAEAQVHGVPLDEVHFHEVGAVDSIIDAVGAAIGLEYLGVERLYASALPLGSGQVNTQHGLLPVPAPATLRLLTTAHAPVVPSQAQVELVTPTGAAILAALATFQQPAMTLTGLGMGAGRRDLPWPNVLRLLLGESEAASLQDENPRSLGMVVIETNIDDTSAQALGHAMGRLLSAGALDVFFTPIYMKKNRPATMLSVIARKSDEATLARLILVETTTFGMRVQPIYRYEAERAFRSVQTEYGEVPLKLKILDGKVVQAAPEYEVCARLANEHNVPLAKVYAAAAREANELTTDKP